MPRQVIPHDQWAHFFGHISHEYAGRMATIEMVPESEGPRLVAFDQPLDRVSAADEAGRTTIAIRLGQEPSELTIETPLRVHTWPFERGGGQVVEIEAAGTPLTRLYLSHSAEQSTGRGEIFGGAGQRERSVGSGIARANEAGGDRTTAIGFGVGGDVDVADLGASKGVIDTTRDPIGEDDGEDDGMDATDDMVEGEVGAQAERDLTELLGQHSHGRFDPDDARLQQRLDELIEEEEDEEEASGV